MDSRQRLQAKFSLIPAVGAVLAVLLLQEHVTGPRMEISLGKSDGMRWT